jgi:hypothetical protein
MKINLITADQKNTLESIFTEFPTLTLQNKGYEGLDKRNLTDQDNEKIKEIEVILKSSVCGFSRFQNFKVNKAGKTSIRFQYDYDADNDGSNKIGFIGVGYILVDELLNGFNLTKTTT